jgi:sialidase-1
MNLPPVSLAKVEQPVPRLRDRIIRAWHHDSHVRQRPGDRPLHPRSWRGLLALALVFSTAAAGAAPVAMEHVVLHRDDTQYYLGPSLCLLPGGEVLLGLREAHARPGADSHVDATSRGVLLRSRDGGRTFGEKRVIDDRTHRSSATQDTTVTALKDGSLLATFYTWGIAPVPGEVDLAKAPPGDPSARTEVRSAGIFQGLWTVRSTDGGRTWTPRRPVTVTGLPPLAARAPVIEQADGSLLLIVNDYNRPDGKTRVWARIHCLRSMDQGATWAHHALVGDGAADRLHFLEPGWVRLRDGRILAMLRTRGEGAAGVREAPPAGYLFQTVSADGGRTWTKPAPTPMWGFPAHLLELRDGRILCAYGYRQKPYGVRATLSRDGGRTWAVKGEIVVRDDGGSVDLGYPVSVQLADDTVLMAYYFNQERAGAPETATRYIAGTRLRL